MIKRFIFSSIGISILTALLIIGGAIALKSQSPKPSTDIRSKIDLIAQESIKNALETGQLQNDDWEKALKVITGTSTLDEKIAELEKSTVSGGGQSEENLSETAIFSRELLEKYVTFRNNGGVLDDETSIRFVNELINKDYGTSSNDILYTERDITILDTNAPLELKKYGNSLGMAINKGLTDDFESEIALLERAYSLNDYTYLENLNKNLSRYEQIVKDLLTIPAPRALKEAHIAIINAFSSLKDGVQGMMLLETDPVAGTKLILRYEEGFQLMDVAFTFIQNYFAKQNIQFSSYESGYIFSK